MLQTSSIRKVLPQVLGDCAYLALVVILYWRGLTDAGAVAILLGLLFLFKTVVDSGASPKLPSSHGMPAGAWMRRAVCCIYS